MNQAALDALLARAQRDGRLPSVVGGVAVDGQTVWTGAAGQVVGVPADVQYRIGSITKSMTAVMVLQAMRDGLVDLDQPLSAYVEEAPYADRTVRDLLSHSSGIATEPVGPWWERSTRSWAQLQANTAVLAEPGEHYLYSNLAYGLLGELLQRVRGVDWASLVTRDVLTPLGMTRTSYLPQSGHATGYSVHYLLSTLTPEPNNDTGAMAAAGQLWSTVGDLLIWACFLLDGHESVLSRDLVALMATPHAPGGTYGLGLQLVTSGSGLMIGHTGTMPGFMAKIQVDRARRRAAVVLANGTVGLDPNGLTGAMLDLPESVDRVGEPWLPSLEVPTEAAAMVGRWYWGHRPHDAIWSHGELVVQSLSPHDELERFTWASGEWVDSMGVALQVEYDEGGKPRWWWFDTYLFTREPYDVAAPIPGGL